MPHYICSNPFLQLSEGIETMMYHSDSPRYFSCVLSLDLKNRMPVMYETGPNLGIVHITPDQQTRLYFIVVDDNLNKSSTQKMQKTLRQQAQFFIDQFVAQHYNSSEDKGSWMWLRDYNSLTPGLQIIHFKAHNTFLVSCERGLHGCANEQEVSEFLTDILEYPENHIENGGFNIIDPGPDSSAQAV
ncbi:hypothetical protein SIO70_00525 [Chitinophaga sancti]|uniref:hypothetical protein n=1 Tax=Chitinophaga sancti TaxID=1004 RepID=UPI002A75EFC6|nr:hypothetical protein [Chitinophaga sancti]WPQ63347.1 hypothetical protein SIO70_00525 [Chitinophaga sancti]